MANKQVHPKAISEATSGDRTIIAGVTGRSIFVQHLEFQNTSDTTLTVIIKLGTVALNGLGYVLDPGDTYRYVPEVENARVGAVSQRRDLETGSGLGLVLNLSASKQISGFALYTVEQPSTP